MARMKIIYKNEKYDYILELTVIKVPKQNWYL